MKTRMTISDYLAHTVPSKCFEVLEESGYQFDEPKNSQELALILKKYIALDRDSALKKLAEIHPDKDLLQSLDREVNDYDYQGDAIRNMTSHGYENPFNKTPFRVGAPTRTLNANGCGCGMSFNGYNDFYGFHGHHHGYMSYDGCNCGCGGKKMNADGGSEKKDYTPFYMLVGLFALVVYFAEVKNKN